MPSKATIKGAVKALEGFQQILENEMLQHGVYLSEQVERPDLAAAGAICGGHRACAVGSLWLGAGVKIKAARRPFTVSELPGTGTWERDAFLADKPGLKLAYDTLNTLAAERYPRQLAAIVNSPNYGPGEGQEYVDYVGAMEALFESGKLRGPGRPRDDGRAGKAEQQKLIDLAIAARERLAA